MTAEVTIRRSASGELMLALPGSLKDREIPVTSLATISRVLRNIETGEIDLGLDGAPTEMQVWHWEHHGVTKSTKCAFCRSELASEMIGRGRASRPAFRAVSGGDVTVRHIPTQPAARRKCSSAPKVQSSGVSAEEMGF